MRADRVQGPVGAQAARRVQQPRLLILRDHLLRDHILAYARMQALARTPHRTNFEQINFAIPSRVCSCARKGGMRMPTVSTMVRYHFRIQCKGNMSDTCRAPSTTTLTLADGQHGLGQREDRRQDHEQPDVHQQRHVVHRPVNRQKSCVDTRHGIGHAALNTLVQMTRLAQGKCKILFAHLQRGTFRVL